VRSFRNTDNLIRSAKTDACRLCVTLNKTRGPELETFPKAMRFWNSWVKFEFGKKQKR